MSIEDLARRAEYEGPDQNSAAWGMIPITPDDDAPLPRVVRQIRAPSAGILHVDMPLSPDVYLRFEAFETRDVIVTKVYATGTTISTTEAPIEGML